MHVLIIGAAGMLGRKLTQRLVADGGVGGEALSRLTLADVVAADDPGGNVPTTSLALDISATDAAGQLISDRPDLIFHLAAIVSGEAETDFEKGYRINLDGTRQLFEAIRLAGPDYRPRVVFTSSIAVFGSS
jgi:D-erythronate 2-dehydrogenase